MATRNFKRIGGSHCIPFKECGAKEYTVCISFVPPNSGLGERQIMTNTYLDKKTLSRKYERKWEMKLVQNNFNMLFIKWMKNTLPDLCFSEPWRKSNKTTRLTKKQKMHNTFWDYVTNILWTLYNSIWIHYASAS